jgi:D-alanyl-D-alanine carboxypeptidase/D-alanyl-D-alanine-endopeptidase (penicillin-binding protein 4)
VSLLPIGLLALTQAADPTATLNEIFSRPEFKGGLIAAQVATLDGRVLYRLNDHQRVVPASNQKLITAAFCLQNLPPTYQPETRFWRTETGLTIDSPGDPSLTYNSLLSAANQLKLAPGTAVRLREAYAPGVPIGWELDDLPNRYAAKVTAFTVDRGGFELWAQDGRLSLRPRNYGVEIRQIPGSAPLKYDPFRRTLIFSGPVPAGTKLVDTLALPQPDENAASIFGQYAGPVEFPPARPAELVIKGRPVSEILARCLQPSDNQLAEHLLLMSLRQTTDYPAAQTAVQKFLTETVKIPADEVRVLDGSGMSRHNLVTVNALCSLLAWEAKQPNFNVFRDALASPGIGTLAGRLDGIAFAGKTGSLDAVAALSGYLQTSDGRQVVVSFISNHHLVGNSVIRQRFDEVVRAARAFRQ